MSASTTKWRPAAAGQAVHRTDHGLPDAGSGGATRTRPRSRGRLLATAPSSSANEPLTSKPVEKWRSPRSRHDRRRAPPGRRARRSQIARKTCCMGLVRELPRCDPVEGGWWRCGPSSRRRRLPGGPRGPPRRRGTGRSRGGSRRRDHPGRPAARDPEASEYGGAGGLVAQGPRGQLADSPRREEGGALARVTPTAPKTWWAVAAASSAAAAGRAPRGCSQGLAVSVPPSSR